MKRVFIVHGWGDGPETNWIPWLSKQLSSKGFVVYPLLMPDTDNPQIQFWVTFLSNRVGLVDSETFFVGHSLGCQAILRYFAKLRPDKVCGGVLFVAPFMKIRQSMMVGDVSRVLTPWVETNIDLSKAKIHAKTFVSIVSDNDPYIDLDDSKTFERELGSKIIVVPNGGHFTVGKGGYKELHVALNELMKMAK